MKMGFFVVFVFWGGRNLTGRNLTGTFARLKILLTEKLTYLLPTPPHPWPSERNSDHSIAGSGKLSQIAKFMGPIWGPPGSCRPQMGPMLATWTHKRQYPGPSVVYIMACRLFGACLAPAIIYTNAGMLLINWLNFSKNSIKTPLKIQQYSWKEIIKCRLDNDGHFYPRLSVLINFIDAHSRLAIIGESQITFIIHTRGASA